MHPKRVLIVDDNPTNLRLAVFMLAPAGYDLRTAASAHEARAAIASFQPELLLLDLQLPDQDGLTLTRELKSNPRTSHIPVIAVTASAMKGDEEKALKAGVCAYVTKPVDKKILREVVAKYLRELAP